MFRIPTEVLAESVKKCSIISLQDNLEEVREISEEVSKFMADNFEGRKTRSVIAGMFFSCLFIYESQLAEKYDSAPDEIKRALAVLSLMDAPSGEGKDG